VNLSVVSGRVRIAVPARAASPRRGRRFVPLTEARQVPVGSFLDTRRGTVRLVSATLRAGRTQAGRFNAGVFQVLQSRKRKARGLTELRLKGSSFRPCKPRKRTRRNRTARAALSRRAIRRLRSNARGRFRTRGRYSAATVRGTKWLAVDPVRRHAHQGHPRPRRRTRLPPQSTVLVKRGKGYLAKARPTR
jgi:hypothetical protein